MQPVRFLSALTFGALLIGGLAACSSGTTPGWTYAPPPTPTVAPSTAPGAPSTAPGASAGASIAPSEAASSAPSVAASGGTGATTVLTEVAQNVQFKTLAFEAPAGQPFQIAFDNQDASIMHNVQIADGSGVVVFKGDIVTGVAQATYNVGALPAGAYKFSCTIHPSMVGDLTVK